MRKPKNIDNRLEELEEKVKKPETNIRYVAVWGDEVEEGENDFVAEWKTEPTDKLRHDDKTEPEQVKE